MNATSGGKVSLATFPTSWMAPPRRVFAPCGPATYANVQVSMMRTLFASTAIAGMMIATAHAQDTATDPVMPDPGGAIEAPAPGADIAPAPGADPLAPPAAGGMDDAFVEDWSPVELQTVSTDELIGADIRTTMDDSQIGTVGDVVIGADGNTIDGIVAQFGGFLGFGRDRVMISTDDVEIFQDSEGRSLVRTPLSQDALEAMPEYEG